MAFGCRWWLSSYSVGKSTRLDGRIREHHNVQCGGLDDRDRHDYLEPGIGLYGHFSRRRAGRLIASKDICGIAPAPRRMLTLRRKGKSPENRFGDEISFH